MWWAIFIIDDELHGVREAEQVRRKRQGAAGDVFGEPEYGTNMS